MNNLKNPDAKVISKDEAEIVLKPYLDAFWHCIVAAWKSWEQLGEIAPALRVPLSNRCRAAFVYDHIVYNAKGRFDKAPGVRITEERGFLLLDFDGKALIRFKKLDRAKRASNIPTRQQLLFSLQMELPGMPDATRLIAGYQLDRLQSSIQGILITCPIGSRLKWFFELNEPMSGTTILFPTPNSGDPNKGRPRVRAKNIEKTEERKQ